MTAISLRSSTAVVVALSLMQSFPTVAQTPLRSDRPVASTGQERFGQVDPRPPAEICADVAIVDALACELQIRSLEDEAQADMRALPGVGRADPKAADQQDRRPARDAADAGEPAAKTEAEARGKNDGRERTRPDQVVTPRPARGNDTQARAEPAVRAAAGRELDAAKDEAERARDAARQPAQPPAVVSQDCLAEVVAADGTIVCADELTGETIAAIGTGTAAAAADVVIETVTDSSSRSSSEEFRGPTRADRDRGNDAPRGESSTVAPLPKGGLSDLERAGLLVLGAAVVGAILTAGQRVEANTGDRVVVVDDDGRYRVLKDDDALLRQPGSEMRTERFADGSTRTTVIREDGARIVTIRDSAGRALRCVRIEPDGREYLLIDDTRPVEPVVLRDLPPPMYNDISFQEATDRESLRAAMLAAEQRDLGRSFTLRQVRDLAEVRALSPLINLEAVTFATGSAAVQSSQAERLRQVGLLMRDLVSETPTELFLIEGYTDAVGNAGYNLLLSDRRAESVALALTEYFGVPAENMVIQGYGESFLRVATQEAERLNRRVAVRRITTLVRPY
jgi:outer membrane protein OmpA-like peptidoglycan-associated protein